MRRLVIDDHFGSTMVIVPHQDDEILMAAGLMYELNKNKQPVSVVMVTNGDCECLDQSKGIGRLQESVEGLRLLGITEDKFIILGYADTGMPPEKSFLTRLYGASDDEEVVPSFCGTKTYGLQNNPDFHQKVWGTHGLYNRKCLKEDIKTAITEIYPKNIFTTAECDFHGDHSALYRFLVEILDELQKDGYHPNLYCGLIHSCAGDDNWPIPETSSFTYPEGLEENSNLKWEERFALSMPVEMTIQKKEGNLKYKSLSKYIIALEPDAVEFLMAFIKDEEIFWKMR